MLDSERIRRSAAAEGEELAGRIAGVHAAADARIGGVLEKSSLATLVAEMQAQEEVDFQAREESEPDWYREQGLELEAAERLAEGEKPYLRSRELRRTFGAAVDQAAFE